MTRVPLSNVDLAWLRMDDPNNLMVITGIITLETPLEFSKLRRVIAGTLLKYERFLQRIVFSPSLTHHPDWEDDPNFELDRHLERVRLSPPAGQAELQDFISQLMSVPLDYEHPLWKMYLIEQFGGGSVVVARLHHAIADGIALVHVLLTMTSEQPDAPLPKAIQLHQSPRKKVPDISGKGESNELERLAYLSADVFGKVTEEGFRMLTDLKYARHQAGLGVSAAVTFTKMLLRIPDPPTVFKAEPGYEKRAAWSEPLDLDQVKLVRRSMDATVNDVLLSCVAGGLRRYLISIGRPVEDLNLRGFVPVNLRPIDLAKKLGNDFGLVMLPLPLGIEDPVERLDEMKRRMDDIKSSPEAMVAFGVLAVLGAAPETIHNLGVKIFDTKVTAVMTNVAGPKKQLYMAGSPIDTVMAWVPQSGRISLGVSIFSYNNKVWIGVASDKALVPDPSRILQHFNEEFRSLYKIAARHPAPPVRDLAYVLARLDKAIDTVDYLIEEKQKARFAQKIKEEQKRALHATSAKVRTAAPKKTKASQRAVPSAKTRNGATKKKAGKTKQPVKESNPELT